MTAELCICVKERPEVGPEVNWGSGPSPTYRRLERAALEDQRRWVQVQRKSCSVITVVI